MRGIVGSFVLVGDGTTPPIAGGGLLLGDDEQVVAVGEGKALARAYPSVRVTEHRAVLLPGLVNAHTHLELSGLRGQVPGGRGFAPWVAAMLQARERLSKERDAASIARAVDELLAAGTAGIGEVTNTLASIEPLRSAPILGSIFHEVFGQRRENAEMMLMRLEQARAAIEAWPSNLAYAPAPHTLFTLHPEILREVLRRARVLHVRS